VEWGILAIAIVFVIVGYIVLQGTRASLAWRKAAAAGDVEVIRRMLEDAIEVWAAMKRPKDAAPELWRAVQSVELVDVEAESARVTCQVEGEYRQVEGRWLETTSLLQQAFGATARLADMLLYDVPNLRLASARIDVYTTFREPEGPPQHSCILTTTAGRETARDIDWDEWTAEQIVDAFGGRYRLGERGAALPLELEDESKAAPGVESRVDG
jgi:hypothetical protein